MHNIKLGRNDPCWCGSGKKYKKCHMIRDGVNRMTAPLKTPLPVNVKSAEEIEKMRAAGSFNGQLMDHLRGEAKPGVSTGAIDALIEAYTRDHGHIPATKGYKGYPKSCCISRNEVVCHGIPGEDIFLEDGDIANIDITTIVDGYYGDQSETFLIGDVSDEARRLVDITAQAFLKGLDAVAAGATLNAIGRAVQEFAESNGYSVIRDYTGHGIGSEFHEMYSVFHHVLPEGDRIVMQPGMTFTVEPMLNQGHYLTELDADGWTVYTRDRKLSAQFEHTVLVTEEGMEILTLTPSQKQAGARLIVDGKPYS